jgi:hypothetical protein
MEKIILNESRENHKDIWIIIDLYQRFFNKDFYKNKIESPLLRVNHDETSMTPENMDLYFSMLRNLINNIWKEVLDWMWLDIAMPQILTISSDTIYQDFNNTNLDDLSVCYNPTTNTILMSDEFIRRLNNFLPIITSDICIAMAIAHEFWHALANQLSRQNLWGKHVEHFCDMVAGFTLQQMWNMDLLDEPDIDTGCKMFHRLWVGCEETHGNPDERLQAFLSGYQWDLASIRKLLEQLLPVIDVKIKFINKKIFTIISDKKYCNNN